MELIEILNLVRRSKSKINLVYTRKSGKEGHVYIDPSQAHNYFVLAENSYTRWYVSNIDQIAVDRLLESKDMIRFSCFSQKKNSIVEVLIKDLHFQNEKRYAKIKVLYG